MDPLLLRQLKRIVKRDISEEGPSKMDKIEDCTEKCKLISKINELKLKRARPVAEAIHTF